MQNLEKRGWTVSANGSFPAGPAGCSFGAAANPLTESVRDRSQAAKKAAGRAGMRRAARSNRVMSGSDGQAGTIQLNPGRKPGFRIQRVGGSLRPNKSGRPDSSESRLLSMGRRIVSTDSGHDSSFLLGDLFHRPLG